MRPIKIIRSHGEEKMYGLIMRDFLKAELWMFDRFGNPTTERSQYINNSFERYCEKNDLKNVNKC